MVSKAKNLKEKKHEATYKVDFFFGGGEGGNKKTTMGETTHG